MFYHNIYFKYMIIISTFSQFFNKTNVQMWFVKVKGCKMNIQPPPSSFRMDKRNTFLEKSAEEAWEEAWRQRRRWAPARGQAADNPAHSGSRRTVTRSGAATGSACVPARWSEEGDYDERRREAKWWWSEPNAGDEDPRLDPLGFWRGAKRRQGGACRRGACVTFASTSVWQLRRGVEGAAKKVYRTSSLTLQRPRRRRGKFLWISLPFYLFYRWSLW
jgi:hypothetical protein